MEACDAAIPTVTTYPARAASTPSRTARAKAREPWMTWSAANDPSTTSGPWRSASTAAARPIAAIESRGDGSASTAPVLELGQLGAHGVDVPGPGDDHDRARAGRAGASRSTVACSRLRPLPVRSCRNLGAPDRDSGHSRVPAPPAGMTAWKPGIGPSGVCVMGPP